MSLLQSECSFPESNVGWGYKRSVPAFLRGPKFQYHVWPCMELCVRARKRDLLRLQTGCSKKHQCTNLKANWRFSSCQPQP